MAVRGIGTTDGIAAFGQAQSMREYEIRGKAYAEGYEKAEAEGKQRALGALVIGGTIGAVATYLLVKR